MVHPSWCNEKKTDSKSQQTEKMNVREGQGAAGVRYPLKHWGVLFSGLWALHVNPFLLSYCLGWTVFPPNSHFAIPGPRTSECDLFRRQCSKEAIKLKWAVTVGLDLLCLCPPEERLRTITEASEMCNHKETATASHQETPLEKPTDQHLHLRISPFRILTTDFCYRSHAAWGAC